MARKVLILVALAILIVSMVSCSEDQQIITGNALEAVSHASEDVQEIQANSNPVPEEADPASFGTESIDTQSVQSYPTAGNRADQEDSISIQQSDGSLEPLGPMGSGCINLSGPLVIEGNSGIRLCNAFFEGDSIIINGSNVLLDCNGATLSGNRTGTAVYGQGYFDQGYWMNKTNNLGNLSPILENMTGFLKSVTFLENITIMNCNINGYESGINLTAVNNSRIIFNHISASANGIFVAGKDIIVEDNHVDNADYGILAGGINVSLRYNYAFNNSNTGIGIGGINCTARNNTAAMNMNGIGAVGFSIDISNNTVFDNEKGITGLFLFDSSIEGNDVHSNWKQGISIAEAGSNIINNNIITLNDIGISMSGFITEGPSESNILEDNIIINNTIGMKFSDSNLKRLFTAIVFMVSRMFGSDKSFNFPGHRINGTIIENNTMDNPTGIVVEGNEFINNVIENNEFIRGGIDIDCSLGNTIMQNRYLEDAGLIGKNAPCASDADCDDNNISTEDTCISKLHCNGFCSDGEVNVNGTIYDELGNPVPHVNISFYPASTYDIVTDQGDEDLLEPKYLPDVQSDENGYYEVYLPEGSWHMVMEGSKKIDFNVTTLRTKKGGHDTELFENETYDPETDFNVEGHIIHSGNYEHVNNYTCGQYVEFIMFGRNKGSGNVTISYAVESHNKSDSPSSNRSVCSGISSPGLTGNPEIVYCSDPNNETQRLFLPDDKKKYTKEFGFRIPCGLEPGKYDIHVYDNSKWGRMHKIGNFFIVTNTVLPWISAESGVIYTQQDYDMVYEADREELDTTIPGLEYYVTHTVIQAVSQDDGCGLDVSIDKDIDVDTDGDLIPDNDVDDEGCGGIENNSLMFSVDYKNTSFYPTVFNRSRVHTAKLTVRDRNDNSENSTLVNISVHINESEADQIALPIYILYGVSPMKIHYDIYHKTSSGFNYPDAVWDMADVNTTKTGHEYLTEGDETDLTPSEHLALELVLSSCSGQEYYKAINSTTAQSFSDQFNSFLNRAFCECRHLC